MIASKAFFDETFAWCFLRQGIYLRRGQDLADIFIWGVWSDYKVKQHHSLVCLEVSNASNEGILYGSNKTQPHFYGDLNELMISDFLFICLLSLFELDKSLRA